MLIEHQQELCLAATIAFLFISGACFFLGSVGGGLVFLGFFEVALRCFVRTVEEALDAIFK